LGRPANAHLDGALQRCDGRDDPDGDLFSFRRKF
jgi:hypothetical protein